MRDGPRSTRQPSASASMFGRGPMAGVGMPVQKAKDFKGTVRRLTGYLAPHRPALIVIVSAGVIATLFSVIGPKMLGLATTRIFEGYLARDVARVVFTRERDTWIRSSCPDCLLLGA